MRYLILSDIHANLEALEATLSAAGEWDAALVLGDLVGYGADPNAVIERVRALPNATIIRGNHDKVGSGVETVESFNHLARHAIAWTATALTPEHRSWLAAMTAGPALIDDVVEICHGSPFDEDAYIFDDLDARRAISASTRAVCLFGHTHVPAVFKYDGELTSVGPPRGARFRLTLDPKAKYLINCGAVGQPGMATRARPSASSTRTRARSRCCAWPTTLAPRKRRSLRRDCRTSSRNGWPSDVESLLAVETARVSVRSTVLVCVVSVAPRRHRLPRASRVSTR